MDTQKEQTGKTPNWLQRVQEQSWEPEILISGIVLFGLLQLPPYIEELGRYLNTYSFTIFSAGNVDRSLIAVLFTANYWLIGGFTIHLILRSVWVAFVGLSYVYPQGVRKEKLPYSSFYLKLISKQNDYQANILRLETICSTVFAVSFLLFMSIIGAFLFLLVATMVLATLFELFPDFMKTYESWIDPVLSVICLIYLFDFISLGLLKRIPLVNKVYYPFYRVMSVLTLAPLYRHIYYGFVSNHNRWLVALWVFLFAVISFFMARSILEENQFLNVMELEVEAVKYKQYHGYYDNLMGEDPSMRIHIQSDIVEEQVLRTFVVHSSSLEESHIYPLCDYQSQRDEPGINLDSLKMICLKRFYKLKLNGKSIEPDFLFHEKQSTGQVGLLAYIDISHLDRGMHKLTLQYMIDQEPVNFSIVAFYKESSVASEVENFNLLDSIPE